MSEVQFGWRLPMWPADDTPMPLLLSQIREHLARLDGHFDSVWLSDHFVPGNNWKEPETPTLECWTAMVHFATAYPSFRYGNIVLANSYRQPSLLAKMAATLHALVGDRLILGIGAGWKEDEYRAYGYAFPGNAVRLRQLEEAVQIIRRMWRSSPASFEGRHYTISSAYCEPMPRPVPPILIGGGGEQLTLRIVARQADWWNLPGSAPETYARKLDLIAQYCQEIGRDPSTIVKTWECACVAVGRTVEEAQRMAEATPFYRQTGPAGAIVGTPEMVAAHLERYRALGVSHFILRFADFPRLDGILRFVEEVAPLLQRPAS